jgi:hypothetical protein
MNTWRIAGLWLGLLCLHAVAADVQAEFVVNRLALAPDTVEQLRLRFGQVRPGRYWYDTLNGAWGHEGGPTAGWLPPGLALPAPLRADASGGGHGRLTGVFINGRELHPQDVQGLTRLTGSPPWPGSWWVDGLGNFGLQQGAQRLPAIGNLWQLAQRQGRHEPFAMASPDGKQFLGRDSDGHSFATGSRGEPYHGN